MKRLLSGILVLVLILSISAVALAKDNGKLPGAGFDKDGNPIVHGLGHDWAGFTQGNSNENKDFDKDNPGYQNHVPGCPTHN